MKWFGFYLVAMALEISGFLMVPDSVSLGKTLLIGFVLTAGGAFCQIACELRNERR